MPAALLAWSAAPGAQELSVALEEVASGLTEPIGIAHAGDSSGRLFVIEQPGRIRIVARGTLYAEPFLDVSERISAGGERGLLGLAFHPDHASNGEFFIHFTDPAGDTVLERCRVSPDDPDRADPGSCELLLWQPQPHANHNGGQLAFGPDRFLYMALGDGGGAGDPEENAQDTSNILGAVLRLDVDSGDEFPNDPDRNYAIPTDNPFVGEPGRDEIWAYGLRNPWRFSFDRMTGDIWIGDVGQADWEEIDFEPAGDDGGRNYGWDVLEGEHCFEDEPPGSCDDFLDGGSTLPVLEYSSNNTGHCSVTGGFRYRGTREPQLFGVYLFADFCSGTVWGTLPNCTGDWEKRVLAETGRRIASFGENENGDQFLVDRSDGTLHRVVVADDSDGPALTPDPASLDYGDQHTVGDTETQTTEITHTGTGSDAVIIETLGLSDTDHFQLDTAAGASPCGPAPVCLEPGDSCTLGATFAPQREGGYDEFLTFLANSPPSPVALLAELACSEVDHRLIENQTVTATEFLYACETITGGDGFTVADGGRAELRAGASVALQPGAGVALGGTLALVIDPVLAEP